MVHFRITSFLDAGTTYSNSEEVQSELREFKDGRLKMLPLFDKFRMKQVSENLRCRKYRNCFSTLQKLHLSSCFL